MAKFRDDALESAYADDLAIARCARNEDKVIASLQPEVDKVVDCPAKAKSTLYTSKCETAFFILSCA